MTKKDLAIKLNQVYPEVSINRAEKIIEHLVNNIIQAVKTGDPVRIPKFGTFTLIKIKGRKIRNPQTKEIMQAKPYLVIRFKNNRMLKNSLIKD